MVFCPEGQLAGSKAHRNRDGAPDERSGYAAVAIVERLSVISRSVGSSTSSPSPSPPFSQVFILKVVKVLCFDTLLQVLILKELEGSIIPSQNLRFCLVVYAADLALGNAFN